MRSFLLTSLTLACALGATFSVMAADEATASAPEEREPAAARRVNYEVEFESEAKRAAALARSGDPGGAAQRFYQLSVDPRYSKSRIQAKYLLGLALADMQLYQPAAFQFIEVLKSSDQRFQRKALERLVIIADQLGNDGLLQFAISRVRIADIPSELRDLVYYRMAEIKLRAGQYQEAVRGFENIRPRTAYFPKARYMAALAIAQNKQPEKAAEMFAELEGYLADRPVNDDSRVAAQLGRARSLYQAGRHEEALQAYRRIPRDSKHWHDALFESAWAMLRATRFRSLLGTMESLQSHFYDDYFMPEALMLRSIVYLYICQFNEMEKTLDTFEKVYKPVQQRLVAFLRINSGPVSVYRDLARVLGEYDQYVEGKRSTTGLALPWMLYSYVAKDGEFQRHASYLKRLKDEEQAIASMGDWRFSPIGRYSIKILSLRIANAEKTAGQIARARLLAAQNLLRDQFEQLGFARYELISAQKSGLEKKVAGKDLATSRVDHGQSRSFYTQNGFEYWPMKNREYWRDEIGSIYFLGVRGCE